MAQGDFSVRIQPVSEVLAGDRFNQIIASINRMAEELSGVETLRTDFVSNVSHEMKTPLAVIKNYATLLSSPELAEETGRIFTLMDGEIINERKGSLC